jgi:hypothetical protein
MEVGIEGCLDMLMLCLLPLTMYPKIKHTHTYVHIYILTHPQRERERGGEIHTDTLQCTSQTESSYATINQILNIKPNMMMYIIILVSNNICHYLYL